MCAAASSSAAPDDGARALIARWVDAQNRGDFDAYRALYAPAFQGIRRSGTTTVKLDHDGWLRDRRRMFRRPMKVTAEAVTVKGKTVELVQTFASGSFDDRGRKRMSLVDVGGQLLIAREELLESLLPDSDNARQPCKEQKVATRAGEVVLTSCVQGERHNEPMWGTRSTGEATLSLAGGAPVTLGTVGTDWEWDRVWEIAGVLTDADRSPQAVVMRCSESGAADETLDRVEVRSVAQTFPILWKNSDQLLNTEIETAGDHAVMRAFHVAAGRKIDLDTWEALVGKTPARNELVLHGGKVTLR